MNEQQELLDWADELQYAKVFEKLSKLGAKGANFERLKNKLIYEGTDQEYPTLHALIAQSQYLHLEPDKAANFSKFFYIFQQGQSHSVSQGYQNGINFDAYDQNMDLGMDDD